MLLFLIVLQIIIYPKTKRSMVFTAETGLFGSLGLRLSH